MAQFIFRHEGSEAEPYELVYKSSEGNVVFSCNCRAGQVGLTCKHRLNLLNGNLKGLVSGNLIDVEEMIKDSINSKIANGLKEIAEAEAAANAAKKRLEMAKKKFGAILAGN